MPRLLTVYTQGQLAALKLRSASPGDEVRLRPVKVLTVTDRAATREQLRHALEASDRLAIAGEIASGRLAVATVVRAHVDAVILGPELPDFDAAHLTSMIREADRGIRVIALTGDISLAESRRLLAAGAAAIIPAAASARVVRETVQLAMDGCVVVTPSTIRQLIGANTEMQHEIDIADSRVKRLSGREHRVLTLVVQGMTNAQIAAEMFIAEGTVKSHVSSVLAKLNLRDRTHAVIYAYEHGLVLRGDNARCG